MLARQHDHRKHRVPLVHEQIALHCAKSIQRAATGKVTNAPRLPNEPPLTLQRCAPVLVELQRLDEDEHYIYAVDATNGVTEAAVVYPRQLQLPSKQSAAAPQQPPPPQQLQQLPPPCPMHGQRNNDQTANLLQPATIPGYGSTGDQSGPIASAVGITASKQNTQPPMFMAQQALHIVPREGSRTSNNPFITTFESPPLAIRATTGDIRAHFATALEQQRNTNFYDSSLPWHNAIMASPTIAEFNNQEATAASSTATATSSGTGTGQVTAPPTVTTTTTTPEVSKIPTDLIINSSTTNTAINTEVVPEPTILDEMWPADANYPPELTQLFQWNYCSLCRTAMRTIRNVADHYSSRAHERRVSSWLIQHCCLQQDAGSPMAQSVMRYLRCGGSSGIYCEVCDLELTSMMHAQQHFFGRRHRLVARQLTKPNGTGYYDKDGRWVRTDGKCLICKLCDVNITSESQMAMHEAGARHRKRLTSIGCAQAVNGSHMYRTNANGSLAPLNARGSGGSGTNNNSSSTTTTTSTNSTFNANLNTNNGNIFSPIQGYGQHQLQPQLKNQQQQQQQQLFHQFNAGQIQGQGLSQLLRCRSEIRRIHNDISAAYYCDVCNITLNHLKSVKQHEEGRMHRKKINRLLFQNTYA